MKSSLILGLAFFVIYAQSQVWLDLGPDDTTRLNLLSAYVDRSLQLAPTESCLNRYFQATSASYRDQLIAFLCTIFGGNPSGTPSPIPECQYTPTGGSGVLFYPGDLTDLQGNLSLIHSPLGISIQEAGEYKTFYTSVANSLGLNSTVTSQITSLYNSFDSSIIKSINGTQVSSPCPFATNVNWQIASPATLATNTIAPGTTICWIWSDTASHTVQGVGNTVLTDAFGTGGSANGIANSSPFVCGPTATPCSISLPPQVCHRFDTVGTFIFTCGIHTYNMNSTIIVSTSSASPSPAAASSSPLPASSSSSGASSLSSFLLW